MATLEKIDFSKLSALEIENVVDKGLRHKTGIPPREYLKHWLWVARHFAYATHDDSPGEFEKEFAIIIKRLVEAERKEAILRSGIERIRDKIMEHCSETGMCSGIEHLCTKLLAGEAINTPSNSGGG